MYIPKEERETIITYNEAEPTASVYTMNGALIRKLDGLAQTRPDDARRVKNYPDGAQEYEVPKKWVKISPPRVYSEEQKHAMEERLRKAQV